MRPDKMCPVTIVSWVETVSWLSRIALRRVESSRCGPLNMFEQEFGNFVKWILWNNAKQSQICCIEFKLLALQST